MKGSLPVSGAGRPSRTPLVLFFVYSNKYACADRIDGARRYAEKAGWNIQVIERNGDGMPFDVAGIIDFWKPVGVIAECGGGIPELSRRTLGSIPCVYLDDNPGNKDRGGRLHVNSDSAAVGELAARELLSLGCKHYAFAGWRRPQFWSEERRVAFERVLKMHGFPCDVFRCPSGLDEIRRRTRLREWLEALPKPCGLFAVHDPVGEDVLTLASASGIQIPEELAVIGVDDDSIICERTSPTLTSIRLDFAQSGYICAELLDRRLQDPGFTDTLYRFSPVFVTHRQSTRRFAQTDRRVSRAVEFIRLKACEGVGAEDVAREMSLSRRMAEILFRRHARRTIHEEIASVRMERVERLLSNPRQEVSAIADLCGWASGSALRKAFKDAHGGLSMREWRNSRP